MTGAITIVVNDIENIDTNAISSDDKKKIKEITNIEKKKEKEKSVEEKLTDRDL